MSRPASPSPAGPFLRLLRSDDREPEERARLARLMTLLAELPPPPDPDGDFPRYTELKRSFLAAAEGADGDKLEERFLELYAHLHMNQAPYTPAERSAVDRSGGYWNHAGGLSPLLKAGRWLKPASRSADFGCGNGLQGLLFQALYPHSSTMLLDISGRALEIGGRLLALYLPFQAMYRTQKNRLFDSLLYTKRQGYLEDVVSRKNTRRLIKGIKSLIPTWYAPDQNFGGERNVFAPFFGIQTATITASARLAKSSGAAMVPFYPERKPDNSGYILWLLPPQRLAST